MKPSTHPIARLRKVSIWEGVSFLVLLFLAMPLKYLAGMPVAVKIVGSIHGALFVLLVICLLHVTVTCRWRLTRAAMVFIAALLPFGPFVMDKRLAQFESEAPANS